MSSPRSSRLALLAPLCALACAQTSGLTWDGAQPEDPEPSGPEFLRSYKESHYRGLGDGWATGASLQQWLDIAATNEVIFLGDHHGDGVLHAGMLALLEELATRSGRRIALGLEAIGVDDEPAVKSYLRKSLDMPSLRRTILGRWSESWLDVAAVDASFYRSVLELARARKLPIFALEPTPRLPLYARDSEITDRIHLARALMPDRLLVIIVGHAHLLGPGKLVARTNTRNLVVGARMSRSLAAAHPDESAELLCTNSGVWFLQDSVTRSPPGQQPDPAIHTGR